MTVPEEVAPDLTTRDQVPDSWISAAVAETASVFQGLGFEPVEVSPVQASACRHGAFLELAGLDGNILLGLVGAEHALEDLCGALVGWTPGEVALSEEEVRDGVQELVNILAGQIKRAVTYTWGECNLGLPFFVTGTFDPQGAGAPVAFHARAGSAEFEVLLIPQALTGDVRERRRLAQDLRDREARLAAILETAADAILTVDTQGRVQSLNPSGARLFQCAPSEDSCVVIECLIPSWRDLALGRLEEGETLAIEVSAQRADGTLFPAEMSVSSFYVAGRLLLAAILRDVSERKQAEQELAEAQRRMADLAREAGMAEVAIDVLHSLGNMLNSVQVSTGVVEQVIRDSRIGLLQRLADKLRMGNSPTEAAFVARLAESLEEDRTRALAEVAALGQRVREIDGAVKRQQRHVAPPSIAEAVRLVELVARVIATPRLAADTVEVAVQCPEHAVAVLDVRRVSDILGELVGNALDAISGVSAPRLDLTVALSARRLSIAVTDNGPGLSPDLQVRIFADGYTTRPGRAGAGLHRAALTATELSGKLSATSAGLGLGTTFLLELPLVTPEDRTP